MKNVINIKAVEKSYKQSRNEIMGEFITDMFQLSKKLGHSEGESDARFFEIAGLKLIAHELMRLPRNRLIRNKPFAILSNDVQGLLPTVSNMIDERIADIKHSIYIRDRLKSNSLK